MKYRRDEPPPRWQTYLADLQGNVCRCGRPKVSGKSFCHRCYYDLPDRMRRALYLGIGHGYEAAYDAAVQYLRDPAHNDGR